MTSYTKSALLLFLLPALASACINTDHEPPKPDYKAEMIATDRAFSRMSEEKGIKNALMQYIDGKGVLLRPDAVPIAGAEAIDYISQANDTSYTMTWDPNGGTVSSSGDLGYTYGVYSFRPKDKDTVIYGTYVSIWKRYPDGKWKFVLQSGNEGIE